MTNRRPTYDEYEAWLNQRLAYRLPDGSIFYATRDLCKAEPVIGFTLKGGRVVDAHLIHAGFAMALAIARRES